MKELMDKKFNTRDFIKTWLYRSKADRKLDEADRFICLWIAFNAWLKSRYTENESDSDLIKKARKNAELIGVFNKFKEEDTNFKSKLNELSDEGNIYNMRYPDDIKKVKRFDGSFETLMDVIYQIRCNLFHGRKDVSDKSGDDYRLICLALKILSILFNNSTYVKLAKLD
jgi:hypothetical protein